ncbi:NAD-binding oxidoreductase [Pseudomaricurvus alkylphenolicus]|uniref:4Fe-4S dicluster domain-containing protein n=1 Tax=Pseudomaricurvus alkylphenolicus TaxID=1306991 RepID=UPI001424802C|nr:reductive dehalogenase domain-containing protein [Pseudomaricurvus alkylphenolicus]NIB42274.1 NAD-binding oxidoreductase [Pseudomaricurvus alkylphenolicus]
MKLFSHKHRPAHLGPYPLERLSRTSVKPEYRRQQPPGALEFVNRANPQSLSNAMLEYVNLMDRLRDGEVAVNKAPIPDDPVERANHLKAAAYFLDASQAATCALPREAILAKPIRNASLDDEVEKNYSVGASQNAMSTSTVEEGASAWQRTESTESIEHHSHALALLIEYPREPDITEPGGEWLVGTQAQRAAVRAAEVAAVLSQYLRFLGFEARAHTATASDVDHDQILLACGLAEVDQHRLANPFLGDRYGVAVITTSLQLDDDQPLAARNLVEQWRAKGPSWWLGQGGTAAAWQGPAYNRRAYHQGRYPMEKVKRQSRPSTFIDDEKVPRVPKRGDMFVRAALGDLGKKAEKELQQFRMITKSPFGHAMMPVLGGMVPMQYGKEAEQVVPGTDDPVKNAASVKAALHYLGADMAGICEIPDYAWYSHDHDGSEIEPYHKYAVSILVDQGYETMEGASGDDWISGAQSMRAYMRAALVGGIVCSHIRSLGYSARTHSVIDQDVLHVPLILLAGMGELSRIGEVVLNPFVGPRFKSGILTTNMPLAVDQPMDFGLQDFCNQCKKCARECPCTAIPFGDKIMFNGYEIWKPDSEKCARYRITNSGGSMCGRCMKTCPWNVEGVLAERPFVWAAMKLPFTRKWLAEFDDKVGNGKRNTVKKWWWDLDTDNDGNILIAKRANERELSFRPPLTPEQQTLGCYPAQDLPTPGLNEPSPVDRKQGKQRYEQALSPALYQALKNEGSNTDEEAVAVMEPVKVE